MNEFIYHFERLVAIIFFASSILVAIELYFSRKGLLRFVFIYCVATILIVSAVSDAFEIDAQEFSCKKHYGTQQLSEDLK